MNENPLKAFVLLSLFLHGLITLGQAGFVAPASAELIAEIIQQDSILFDAAFAQCNPEKVGEMVMDDLEFYHDKWGLVATSGEQFVNGLKQGCERQAQGLDNKARRDLVLESVKVYPINNFGVIQTGRHLFYQFKEGSYVFTESAQFTHIWKRENEVWKLARVLSYDHQAKE